MPHGTGTAGSDAPQSNAPDPPVSPQRAAARSRWARLLAHLGLPTTAPPLSPAPGPPQHDLGFDADPGFDFDQTPAYDPSEPDPVPDFDFDQSAGA